MLKNPSANVGDIRDTSLISGLGISPGGGNGNPLNGKYSYLENSMNRGVWQAIVYSVMNSQT